MGEKFRTIRNDKLAKDVIKNLEKRNMEGYYVQNKEEALALALSLMPEGSSVGWGGSMSTEAIGLNKAVIEGNYTVYNRDAAKTPEEKDAVYRELLFADFFLMGCNAITEDGILLNIDGMGSRLGPFIFGPKNVIIVAGMNKVVKSEADALARARNEAAPINAQRFGITTPCAQTGSCANCLNPQTICCQFVTTRFSRIKGRIKVILVNEELGF